MCGSWSPRQYTRKRAQFNFETINNSITTAGKVVDLCVLRVQFVGSVLLFMAKREKTRNIVNVTVSHRV